VEVVELKPLIIFLILLVFILPAHGSAFTTYEWMDEKGVVNFTDDLGRVPSQYRDRVKEEVIDDEVSGELSPPSQPILEKGEERTTDIYGLGESYWRERVRPWKDRLKEATENYERVHERFMESAEELSKRRYGSRTQYKMNIIELDRLNMERMEFGAQIEEAKEMLAKIYREAEESGADPEWFNDFGGDQH
jgi:hypothetical protein